MALQGSGAISLNDIAGEFGGSVPHSITEYYRGGGLVPDSAANSSIPTSGQISFSQFYNGANITTVGSITVGSQGSQSHSIGKTTTTVTGVTLARGILTAMGSWTDRNADAANSVLDCWFTQTNGFITTSCMASTQTMSGLNGTQITLPNGSTSTFTGGITVKDTTVSNLEYIGQFLVDGSSGSGTVARYGFNSFPPANGTTIFIQ
jgi:hypothetical protein